MANTGDYQCVVHYVVMAKVHKISGQFSLKTLDDQVKKAVQIPSFANRTATAAISKVDIRNICSPITNTRLLLPASPLSVSPGTTRCALQTTSTKPALEKLWTR